jgi:hypothetical protein
VRAGRDADRELAALAARERLRRRRSRARRRHRGAGRLEHRRAGLGQFHARAGAGEQPHAGLQLQPRDLLAQRRLRHVQPLRGTPEVQLVGQRDERTQQPRVHTHARSL